MKQEIRPDLSAATPAEADGASQERFALLGRHILAQDRQIASDTALLIGSRLEFDMLLDLYLAECGGEARCVWDVCAGSPAPISTAHRKIGGMVERGLVRRLPPSGDRRRVTLALSDEARALLIQVLVRLGA